MGSDRSPAPRRGRCSRGVGLVDQFSLRNHPTANARLHAFSSSLDTSKTCPTVWTSCGFPGEFHPGIGCVVGQTRMLFGPSLRCSASKPVSHSVTCNGGVG